MVGKAFNLSRADSTMLVLQGKVFQNWRQQVSPSKSVVEGDVISCSGYGRFRILRCAGMTKKAREKFILGFDPEYK
jgi:RNA-binding protein YlmH